MNVKEELRREYHDRYAFHIHINNKYSLLLLKPENYGYCYELHDLEKGVPIERFKSILDACAKIQHLIIQDDVNKIKKRIFLDVESDLREDQLKYKIELFQWLNKEDIIIKKIKIRDLKW